MANPDFTTTLLFAKTPRQVYDAINDPRNWWPGEIEGRTTRLDDEFEYRYKEFHYSKQRVVELIPNEKVVWLVTESSINFVEDKDEWTGTKIIFEISERDGKTQLRFTHLGLTPGVECFDSCSNAWSQIIRQSLSSLVTTGKGADLVLA